MDSRHPKRLATLSLAYAYMVHKMNAALGPEYDVVIIGGGLAGLSLAQHLLLETDKRILLLEKRDSLPPNKQKYGESSVQVAGYYYAKVLGLEEYLFRNHYMKYNLRFYWKTAGQDPSQFENYCQSYIRTFSNIPCYQLDRNTFEGELLRRNQACDNFSLQLSIKHLDIQLKQDESHHHVSFQKSDELQTVRAQWVIDTTGRVRHLSRQESLRQETPIDHGSAFLWVDGLVDIEKLTDATRNDIRLNQARRHTGHSPQWLGTNHFMGEGFWFWVIPLQGKTSLGVVFDNATFPKHRVTSALKLREWICDEFPLFRRDLFTREILDFSALKSYAHGCKQTISADRWAMSGEAGRFTDPLYSPGSDFISLHNTLIVDAIKTNNAAELKRKCWFYEMLMEAMYNSLLPTYARSYDVLGDQEVFALKYTWELSIYFSFFVFPFINDLATNTNFTPTFLARFARLGDMNAKIQALLSDFYKWKKRHVSPNSKAIFHDFTSLEPLRRAEQTFYHIGVNVDEAKDVLDDQLVSLKELTRFIVAYIYSVVLGNERVLRNAGFIESIDAHSIHFDPTAMAAHYSRYQECESNYQWSLNPKALEHFRASRSPYAKQTSQSLAST